MSARFSTLARNGSNISASSSGSSAVPSSHNYPRLLRSRTMLSAWLTAPNLYERLATGTPRSGTSILTREEMEQASDVRGMLDCLPVAGPEGAIFVGWRKKLSTWPVVPKSDALASGSF
ncbi:hypothetical protein V8E51_006808 [Hyaloscypha variabilis]